VHKFLPVSILALGACFHTMTAQADCHEPTAPANFPDSLKATEQEMLAAQQSVKEYLSEMETALKCMDDHQLARAHDLAVDDMQNVATKFNTILRSFRTRAKT